MVSTGRRQLGLPLARDGSQRLRVRPEAADRILEAMAELMLQVSDGELEANDQTEEADDEGAR